VSANFQEQYIIIIINTQALFLDEQRNIISLWKADDPAGLQLFYFAALELAWKINKLPSWLITYFQNEINNEGNPTGIIHISQSHFL
jgi:hypothetical protein